MEINIFYSWQSDLPPKANNYFIRDCIKKAIKEIEIEQKELINLSIRLDSDTKGETGSPDIVETILRKIRSSNIFISDISIINSNLDGRKTSNPNVLFELGYGVSLIGWGNVICILNEEYGKVESLPFDLRGKRVTKYKLSEDELIDKEKLKAKKNHFSKVLKTAILVIVKRLNSDQNLYLEKNRPIIEAELKYKSNGKSASKISKNNPSGPVFLKDAVKFSNIYWKYDLVIRNNSNTTAYNPELVFEDDIFTFVEELNKLEPLKANDKSILKAKYEFDLEFKGNEAFKTMNKCKFHSDITNKKFYIKYDNDKRESFYTECVISQDGLISNKLIENGT